MDCRTHTWPGVALPQVVEFQPPAEASKEDTALRVYQRCIRVWSADLTPFEFMVAMQIIDRTLGWRKTRMSASVPRMMDGDKVYSGMKIGKTAFFAALSSLEKKGVIARHPHPEGKQIRVYSVNPGWTPAMLNMPKRLKNGAQTSSPDEPDQFAKRTGPVREANTREYSQGEHSQENVDDGGPVPGTPTNRSADEIVRGAMADARSLRRAPTRKLTTLPAKADAAQRAWRAGIEEAFPTGGMTAWSQREVAMVKSKIRGWNDRRTEFHDFIGWCALNWALVCRKQLGWMTKRKPPTTPDIGFLLSFIDQFQEAFADKDLGKWMNEDQTSQYDRLRAKGRSHDEAVHELARQDAIAATRDEVRKERQDITVRKNSLKRREQRVEARERAGARPVHPRSAAARKTQIDAAPRKRLTEEELGEIDLRSLPTLDPDWEPDA